MIRTMLVAGIAVMGFIYIFFIPAEPIGFKILMKLIPMALIILFGIGTRSCLPLYV